MAVLDTETDAFRVELLESVTDSLEVSEISEDNVPETSKVMDLVAEWGVVRVEDTVSDWVAAIVGVLSVGDGVHDGKEDREAVLVSELM